MRQCYILNLISGGRKDISFHTPGHKRQAQYCRDIPMAAMDLTELSYTDDLSSPSGAIAAAQRDIAEIVGAERSYILTDGSTSGVMAMMYAAAKRGKKIIVARNCHKSVWNACAILGIEPVIVKGEEVDGIMQPPDPVQIEEILNSDKKVCGMVITSPDYYGTIAPLKAYAQILKEQKKLLIVDGAHGGHLAFEKNRAGYAGVYADMWTDGVHKSMPALTQAALVHINNADIEEWLEEGLNIFRTSSPSFPVMASAEYAVKYCEDNKGRINNVKNAIFRAKHKLLMGGYGIYRTDDWTKLTVDLAPLGLSGGTVCEILEKNGIYAEFTDGRYIVFYCSVMNTGSDLALLVQALLSMAADKKLKTGTPVQAKFECIEGVTSAGYLKAVKAPYVYLPPEKAAGRVCAANAGISPPCIPLVAAGEIITEQAACALKSAVHTFGLKDGKIKVVK